MITDQSAQPEAEPAVENAVGRWTKRIQAAKRHWKPQFDRMQDNMDFVAGYQWDGQMDMRGHRYVCNMTIQMVNHKVATLYARNPQVAVIRRPRLDFQLWDESQEQLIEMLQRVQQGLMTGVPDVEAEATLRDYQVGRQHQQMVKKVGKTLQYVYQHQIDSQSPEFKEQMKQLVTTTVVCGVGYVRVGYRRERPTAPGADRHPGQKERMSAAQDIFRRMEEGELDETAPEVEQLKLLLNSMGYSDEGMEEGLTFDFPDPTSIIPDPRVTSLAELTGAKWLVQEYILPLDEVNAFFNTQISVTGGVKFYSEGSGDGEGDGSKCVALWEVMDLSSRNHFFIVDGHKEYVQPPAPMEPQTRRFWPVFALTFNRVVVSSGSKKASPFPPSDVDLVFHSQKEWNRTRHSLRGHRKANAPKYLSRKNLLSVEDKQALQDAEENQILELDSLPSDVEPSKFLQPMAHAPIDPSLYDTRPLEADFMMASRTQAANMGPAQPDVTATVGTIAEQSRQSVAASNVDDLDSLLSRMAEFGGEVVMRLMLLQTVQRIVGAGAVWPQTERELFVNEVYLQVIMASSGRPNKAMEVANFERLAPALLQAGVNPAFIIREAVRRLDDQLDVAEAMPVPGLPTGATPPQSAQSGAGQALPAAPERPTPMLASGAAPPLVGM